MSQKVLLRVQETEWFRWNAGREGLRSTRVARGPLVFCVDSKCCKVTEEVEV